jgi:hypothetical protein
MRTAHSDRGRAIVRVRIVASGSNALGVIAAKDVGTGICRIREQPQGTTVSQTAPSNLTRPGATVCTPRKWSIAEEADDAVSGAGCLECGKDVGYGRANLFVRIHDRLSLIIKDIAHWEWESQRTSPRGGALRLLQTTRQDMQFRFRHRPLQTKQQSIIEVLQVVDPIRVHNQGVTDTAEFQQALEVRGAAREP